MRHRRYQGLSKYRAQPVVLRPNTIEGIWKSAYFSSVVGGEATIGTIFEA